VARKLAALRAFCEHLVYHGFLEKNPADPKIVRTPRVSGASRTQGLTAGQAERLLEGPDRTTALGARDYAILKWLLHLGLRREELCRIGLRVATEQETVLAAQQALFDQVPGILRPERASVLVVSVRTPLTTGNLMRLRRRAAPPKDASSILQESRGGPATGRLLAPFLVGWSTSTSHPGRTPIRLARSRSVSHSAALTRFSVPLLLEGLIPLQDGVWRAALEALERSGRSLSEGGGNVALFAPTRNNRTGKLEKAIDSRTVWQIVTRWVKRAGIRKHISPHSQRHTSITLALDGGATLRQAQTFAGHADPKTTVRYDRTREDLDNSAAHLIHLGDA
jgi:site-specific recombinase XerD